MADGEILTIRGVATLLNMGEEIAFTMAKPGEASGVQGARPVTAPARRIDEWSTRQAKRTDGKAGLDEEWEP